MSTKSNMSKKEKEFVLNVLKKEIKDGKKWARQIMSTEKLLLREFIKLNFNLDREMDYVEMLDLVVRSKSVKLLKQYQNFLLYRFNQLKNG